VAEDYVEFASNMMLSSWTRSSAFGGKGPGSVTSVAATVASGVAAGAAAGASLAKNSCNSNGCSSSSTTRTTSATTNGHDRLHYYPLETISALSYLKSPMRRPMVLERWSPYEIAIFEATLAQYGKDFLQVQKELASTSSNHQHSNDSKTNGKTDTSGQDASSSSHQYQYCNKTTKDVVEFYYIWKKTSHYQRWKATYVAPHQDDNDDDDDKDYDDSDNDLNEKSKKIAVPVVKPKRKCTRRIQQPAAASTTGERGSNKEA
jgi:hypothetical protein